VNSTPLKEQYVDRGGFLENIFYKNTDGYKQMHPKIGFVVP
jgi:hypothetical protein